MSWLNPEQLRAMSFASVGKNVRLSDRASFYGAERIWLGDNVRIDDFCVLSAGAGGIEIGSFVHIAVSATLLGSAKISLGDFSGLSSRVSIFSSSDDYSGVHMTNPTVPVEFTDVSHADVTVGRHVIIGCGAVVLPGVTLHDGAAVGALSLVSHDCLPFSTYHGAPAKKIGERKRNLLELERQLLER